MCVRGGEEENGEEGKGRILIWEGLEEGRQGKLDGDLIDWGRGGTRSVFWVMTGLGAGKNER